MNVFPPHRILCFFRILELIQSSTVDTLKGGRSKTLKFWKIEAKNKQENWFFFKIEGSFSFFDQFLHRYIRSFRVSFDCKMTFRRYSVALNKFQNFSNLLRSTSQSCQVSERLLFFIVTFIYQRFVVRTRILFVYSLISLF